MLTLPVLQPISEANVLGCKSARKSAFRPLPPQDPMPDGMGQHLFSGLTWMRRCGGFGSPSVIGGDTRQELNIGGISLLRTIDAHGPLKVPRTERLPKRRGGTVTCIGKHHAKVQVWSDAVKFLNGDSPLALRLLVFLRNTSSNHPLRVTCPVTRQKKAETHGNGEIVLGQRERDQALALGQSTHLSGVLLGNPDRLGSRFGQAGVVDDEDRIFSAEHLVRSLKEEGFKDSGAVRDEMLEPILAARSDHIGHGNHTFPVRHAAQPLNIKRRETTSCLVVQMSLEGFKPGREMAGPAWQLSTHRRRPASPTLSPLSPC